MKHLHRISHEHSDWSLSHITRYWNNDRFTENELYYSLLRKLSPQRNQSRLCTPVCSGRFTAFELPYVLRILCEIRNMTQTEILSCWIQHRCYELLPCTTRALLHDCVRRSTDNERSRNTTFPSNHPVDVALSGILHPKYFQDFLFEFFITQFYEAPSKKEAYTNG